MIKKLFLVTILIMLTLSACSGGGAAQTEAPAVTDTQPATAVIATTAAPTITETVTPQPSGTPPTATPTLGTVAPTNPPDCTNSASFVTDVTIPDETNVAGGTLFTKTWRIANNGTCVWGPDYKLSHYSEERMAAPDSVSVPITYPGQTADISVNLTAPTSTGRHQANFVIKNPTGLIMKVGDDSRLWVVINVGAGGASASTATATTAGATPTNTSPPATLAPATLAVATAGSSSTASAGTGGDSCLYTIDRTKLVEVINAVNAYRAEKSLPAYTVNPRLAQAAQKHASDMACNKLTDDTGSDGSTPQTRVAATGYKATSVAQNVYSSNPPFTGQGVVNWWITDSADTSHNASLVSTTFTEIGVGYALFNGNGYYVIVFAKP